MKVPYNRTRLKRHDRGQNTEQRWRRPWRKRTTPAPPPVLSSDEKGSPNA